MGNDENKENKEKTINVEKIKVFIPKIIKEIIVILMVIIVFAVNARWIFHSIMYVETTATIYKVRYDYNYKSYRPIYEYKFKDKKVRVLGGIVGEEKDFTIGDKVQIMYNKKDYNKVEEGSKKDSAFAWVTCIICLAISGVAVYFIIKKFKKYKEKDFNIYKYGKEDNQSETEEDGVQYDEAK